MQMCSPKLNILMLKDVNTADTFLFLQNILAYISQLASYCASLKAV